MAWVPDALLYGGIFAIVFLLMPYYSFMSENIFPRLEKEVPAFFGVKVEQLVNPPVALPQYRQMVSDPYPFPIGIIVEMLINLVIWVTWMGIIFIPLLAGWAVWVVLLTKLKLGESP